MNERLNLQDLVDLLADKHKITKKEADIFLRELIALIIENIESVEPVKIKDFGTFKPTRIAARKSVNVNTGEAFEIASHYKLSFVPDKVLREAVNRPFSHFESVVLEDGVSFDDVESISDLSEEQEDIEDSSIEDTRIESVGDNTLMDEKDSKETLPLNESVQLETDISHNLENEKENRGSVTLNIDNSDHLDIESAIVESNIPASPTSILNEDDNETSSENTQEESSAAMNHVDIRANISEDTQGIEVSQDEIEHEPSDIRRKVLMVIAVILVGAGVCTWFFKDQLDFSWVDNKLGKNKEFSALSEKKDMGIEGSPAYTDTLTSHSVLPSDTINIAVPNQLKEDTNNKPPVKEENLVNDSPKQVTISPGMTLRSIGLANYGHKSFWVYIYKDNKDKIKNPNNVPLGTILTLPPASKYSIDAKDPESIRKAKKLETNIYTEFGIK